VKARPDHSMGIEIETEQKVNLLNLELSQERIRDIERETARRLRGAQVGRKANAGALRRLLKSLR
jgi:DNA-directed RNA polymerase sigma subunit (sigma70/sigma32)